MKKFAALIATALVAVALTGCSGYFDSQQKKDFDAFLAKCKASNNATQDCKDYYAKEKDGIADGIQR